MVAPFFSFFPDYYQVSIRPSSIHPSISHPSIHLLHIHPPLIHPSIYPSIHLLFIHPSLIIPSIPLSSFHPSFYFHSFPSFNLLLSIHLFNLKSSFSFFHPSLQSSSLSHPCSYFPHLFNHLLVDTLNLYKFSICKKTIFEQY